jgi:hypothetical protein
VDAAQLRLRRLLPRVKVPVLPAGPSPFPNACVVSN